MIITGKKNFNVKERKHITDVFIIFQNSLILLQLDYISKYEYFEYNNIEKVDISIKAIYIGGNKDIDKYSDFNLFTAVIKKFSEILKIVIAKIRKKGIWKITHFSFLKYFLFHNLFRF